MKTILKAIFPKTTKALEYEAYDDGKLYGRTVEYDKIMGQLQSHNLDQFASLELNLGYNQALETVARLYPKEIKK